MMGLADWFKRKEAAAWRKRFGTEFTGMHEGRPVHWEWRERVVGHICMGADPYDDGHLHCRKLVQMQWCWVRKAPPK